MVAMGESNAGQPSAHSQALSRESGPRAGYDGGSADVDFIPQFVIIKSTSVPPIDHNRLVHTSVVTGTNFF